MSDNTFFYTHALFFCFFRSHIFVLLTTNNNNTYNNKNVKQIYSKKTPIDKINQIFPIPTYPQTQNITKTKIVIGPRKSQQQQQQQQQQRNQTNLLPPKKKRATKNHIHNHLINQIFPIPTYPQTQKITKTEIVIASILHSKLLPICTNPNVQISSKFATFFFRNIFFHLGNRI